MPADPVDRLLAAVRPPLRRATRIQAGGALRYE